jgi:hypothetical protein
MFRATHRSSSGAQKLQLQPLVLHSLLLPAAAGNHKRMQNQRMQLQFLSSWWWAVCRSKHVEQLRNIGIINSTTRSHLVGYFYRIYILYLLTHFVDPAVELYLSYSVKIVLWGLKHVGVTQYSLSGVNNECVDWSVFYVKCNWTFLLRAQPHDGSRRTAVLFVGAWLA